MLADETTEQEHSYGQGCLLQVRLIRSYKSYYYYFQIVSHHSRGSINDSNCTPPLPLYGRGDIFL